MGKVTGFMEFERVEEGYKPVPERVKHYKEFVICLSDAEAKVQGARCMLFRAIQVEGAARVFDPPRGT